MCNCVPPTAVPPAEFWLDLLSLLQILEYHHKRSQASMLHPQLPTLHRVSAGSLRGNGGFGGGGGDGSRPGTPGGSAAGGSRHGGHGRRANMFEMLLKSQAGWAEVGPAAAGSGDGGGPAASTSSHAVGAAAAGGAGAGPTGMLSKSASMSDARSSFDSRQNSMSRRDGRGNEAAIGVHRCANATVCHSLQGAAGVAWGPPVRRKSWQTACLRLYSRRLSLSLPLPARRSPLTRPEMALSLLVEVAYEHDEEFRQHLPQASQVHVVLP